MTFTIEQLEALKEEITPGQWEFREHSSYEYPAGPEWGPMQTELEHAVLDAEDNHLFGAYNNYKLIEHPGNLPLAAASPALLDQLITTETKLQKVLNSIEELRDWYNERGEYMHKLYEESLNPRFEEDSASYAQSADHLTEILEGNNV